MAVSPFAENQRVTGVTVKPSRKISKSTKSGIIPLLQESIIDLISRTGAFDPAYHLSCPCDSWKSYDICIFLALDFYNSISTTKRYGLIYS